MTDQTTNQPLLSLPIDPVLAEWGWHPYEHKGRAGLRYPLFDETGRTLDVYRWKALDDKKPKYLWLPTKPDGMAWYLPAGSVDRIKATGRVVICEGEKDCATAYYAGLHKHGGVVSWVDGVGSIPNSLIDYLTRWGATEVHFIPDLDLAGAKAAIKLHEALVDSGITLHIRRVPTAPERTFGSGYDLTDSYMDGVLVVDNKLVRMGYWSIEELHAQIEAVDTSTLFDKSPLVAPSGGGDKTINPRVQEALYNAAIRQGKRVKMVSGQRAIPVLSLPRFGHGSDSVGEHMHYFPDTCTAFEYSTSEQVMGLELCEAWGIDVKGLGGWYADGGHTPTNADLVREHRASVAVTPAKPVSVGSVPNDMFIRRSDVLARGLDTSDILVLPNPIYGINHLGGFAEMLPSGKVAIFAAPSGGGKTIAARLIGETFVKLGSDVVLWSPEWDENELTASYIALNGGSGANDYYADQLVKTMAKRGYTPEQIKRMGIKAKPLADDQRANDNKVIKGMIKAMEQGQGDIHIFNPHYSFLALPNLLGNASTYIAEQRAAGRNMDVFIFDYIQLAPDDPDAPSSANRAEHAFELFKQFCIVNNVIGIMTSQVTKTATDKVSAGKQLDASDAQYIRADKGNLFVIAYRVKVDGQDVLVDYAFKDGVRPTSVIAYSVVKNNLGDSGTAYFAGDYMRYLAMDYTTTIDPLKVKEAIRLAEAQAKADVFSI